MKRLLVRVVLVIALSLGLADLLVRGIPGVPTYAALLNWQGPQSPSARSDYLPFTLTGPTDLTYTNYTTTGTMHLNSAGYRGPEFTPGKRRILFLGDSFTLGYGVPDGEEFVALLRAQFDAEMINAAYHDGYSPDAYYAYLVHEGLALQPDAIVEVLFTGNDVTDLQDNTWTQVDERGAPLAITTSRLYSDYDGRLLNPLTLPAYYHIPLLQNDPLFILAANTLTGNGHGNRLGPSSTLDDAWRRVGVSLKATVALANEAHVPLYFVVLGLPGERLTDDATGQRLLTMLAGQRVLPLYNVLSAADQLPKDGHLNMMGNAKVADALGVFLRDLRLARRTF